MRLLLVVAVLVCGVGCKKKPALVRTPVSQIDPLGGGTAIGPAPVGEDDNSGVPQQPQRQPAQVPDGGVAHQKVIVAPKTTNTPTVASPYIPGGGRERLPMWKQRAKFY
jgi:hypothetical protein